ncbi:MAG: FAD binding domain-containing protein [Burkholderiaceae bacterium]
MHLDRPASPQAAQALADRFGGAACFIAGGTLLQQTWPEPRLAPPGIRFIDVQSWPQTRSVTLEDGCLRIGAGVRLEAARTDVLVRTRAPLLAQALDQLGAAGVRRLGTLGGNIGWGEGDCCPVLLAMDALVELADGRRETLEAVLRRPVRPLMLAFRLPCTESSAPMVFEKVGHRAAFSPARLRMAIRWHRSDRGCAVDRIAAAAPGLPVHRLHAAERLMAGPRPTLADIRAACLQSLPPDLAAIASRLIAGHCGLPLTL